MSHGWLRGRRAAHLMSLLVLTALGTACEERSRPSPADPGVGLDVVLTSPHTGDSFRPGSLPVSVRGHDGIGRLHTLGVVLRTSPAGTRVDSVARTFSLTTDTTLVLHVQLPPVTSPGGFELVGFAVNVTGGDARTPPIGIVVLPCPATGC